MVVSDFDDALFVASFHERCREFFEESGMSGQLDFGFFLSSWRALIEQGQGVMFVRSTPTKITGMLGAVLVPILFTGEIAASELFWFVTASHRGTPTGIRLLNEFRIWARDIGAQRILMGHLHFAVSEKVAAIYDHMGLTKLETIYIGKP